MGKRGKVTVIPMFGPEQLNEWVLRVEIRSLRRRVRITSFVLPDLSWEAF